MWGSPRMMAHNSQRQAILTLPVNQFVFICRGSVVLLLFVCESRSLSLRLKPCSSVYLSFTNWILFVCVCVFQHKCSVINIEVLALWIINECQLYPPVKSAVCWTLRLKKQNIILEIKNVKYYCRFTLHHSTNRWIENGFVPVYGRNISEAQSILLWAWMTTSLSRSWCKAIKVTSVFITLWALLSLGDDGSSIFELIYPSALYIYFTLQGHGWTWKCRKGKKIFSNLHTYTVEVIFKYASYFFGLVSFYFEHIRFLPVM